MPQNYQNQTLLDIYKSGNLALLRQRIIQEKDINNHGAKIDLLIFASGEGNIAVIELLLEHTAYTNADKNRALHYACFNNQADAAKVLLEAGADSNSIDSNGASILMNCCCKDSFSSIFPTAHKSLECKLKIIKLLIKSGANINFKKEKVSASYCFYAPIDEGYTPLTYAAINGQIEIMKLLLQNGANVNEIDKQGKSILLHICTNEIEVWKTLLNAGINVNFATSDGLYSREYTTSKALIKRWSQST